MRIVRIDKDQIGGSSCFLLGGGLTRLRDQIGNGESAMKATIWHNPNCGTSRKTLAILAETPGVELTVVEYLKTPPSADKLAQLYRDAGMTPQKGLRLRGTDAEERGLPQAGDAAVLAAMTAQPSLIERPLVETDKGVRLCRPQEVVAEIL
jgi:arsenate reductase